MTPPGPRLGGAGVAAAARPASLPLPPPRSSPPPSASQKGVFGGEEGEERGKYFEVPGPADAVVPPTPPPQARGFEIPGADEDRVGSAAPQLETPALDDGAAASVLPARSTEAEAGTGKAKPVPGMPVGTVYAGVPSHSLPPGPPPSATLRPSARAHTAAASIMTPSPPPPSVTRRASPGVDWNGESPSPSGPVHRARGSVGASAAGSTGLTGRDWTRMTQLRVARESMTAVKKAARAFKRLVRRRMSVLQAAQLQSQGARAGTGQSAQLAHVKSKPRLGSARRVDSSSSTDAGGDGDAEPRQHETPLAGDLPRGSFMGSTRSLPASAGAVAQPASALALRRGISGRTGSTPRLLHRGTGSSAVLWGGSSGPALATSGAMPSASAGDVAASAPAAGVARVASSYDSSSDDGDGATSDASAGSEPFQSGSERHASRRGASSRHATKFREAKAASSARASNGSAATDKSGKAKHKKGAVSSGLARLRRRLSRGRNTHRVSDAPASTSEPQTADRDSGGSKPAASTVDAHRHKVAPTAHQLRQAELQAIMERRKKALAMRGGAASAGGSRYAASHGAQASLRNALATGRDK